MATRGRPSNNGIHKVSYYQLSPKLVSNAYQKALEDRLKGAYDKLFVLAHHEKPNQRDMVLINKLVREGLSLL
jgi:hypothetical protein